MIIARMNAFTREEYQINQKELLIGFLQYWSGEITLPPWQVALKLCTLSLCHKVHRTSTLTFEFWRTLIFFSGSMDFIGPHSH